MSKSLLLLLVFFTIFNNYKSFEIDILDEHNNQIVTPIKINPIEISEFVGDMFKDLMNQEDDGGIIENRKRKKPIKPHRLNKKIVETRGPGYSTVEVTEIFDKDENNDSTASASSNSNDLQINDILGNGFPININMNEMLDEMIAPKPFIFVTSTKKNLKSNGDNRENPFKIFQNMDNMFDSFFKINNKRSSNTGQFNNINNINNNIKNFEDKQQDHIKIINITDITNEIKDKRSVPNKAEINRKLDNIAHINSRNDIQINIPNATTSSIAIKSNNSIDKNELSDLNKSNNTNYHVRINTEIFKEISLYYTIIKYSIYLGLLCCIGLLLKCLVNKVNSSEQKQKKENTKHSINEVEDELKSLKEKNKLF